MSDLCFCLQMNIYSVSVFDDCHVCIYRLFKAALFCLRVRKCLHFQYLTDVELSLPFFWFVCFFGLFPQDNSKWRRHYLSSLYEYMQGCNKELAFLGEEQDKIRSQDWSDHMIDPPDVRRQYEVRTVESEQWNMQILFNNCSSRTVQYLFCHNK